MKRRILLLGTGALALQPAVAVSNPGAADAPAEVAAELPAPRLAGGGRLRVFGLHIYDARLWLPASVNPGEVERGAYARVPLALEIEYARRLYGAMIAERSLHEMRRLGEIDDARAERWLAAMRRLFPDVAAGDRISGVQWPGRSARFHVNGRFAGEMGDPDFTRLFFGIWLSPDTSEPALRQALLGR